MKNKNISFRDFINKLVLIHSRHIIIHSSFKKIHQAFNNITPQSVIKDLKDTVSPSGSIIFPAFTYCFKRSTGNYEIFDRTSSKSKVGFLSETFRLSDGVIRTSSPTHSFALWGKITKDIDESNSPESPLGTGSVLEWMSNQKNSFVLMLGTDFSSLSYGHYLEIAAKVPWFDFSPWDYMNVLPIGISISGEQKLKEIPGCAKSFVNFESYLLEKKSIRKYEYQGLSSYFIRVKLLYDEGMKFFSKHYDKTLCPENTCSACDSRRRKFI